MITAIVHEKIQEMVARVVHEMVTGMVHERVARSLPSRPTFLARARVASRAVPHNLRHA